MAIVVESFGQTWVAINWAAKGYTESDLPRPLHFITIAAWLRRFLYIDVTESPIERIQALEGSPDLEKREHPDYNNYMYWAGANRDMGVDFSIPVRPLEHHNFSQRQDVGSFVSTFSKAPKAYIMKLTYNRSVTIMFVAVSDGKNVTLFSPCLGETSLLVAELSKLLDEITKPLMEGFGFNRSTIVELNIAATDPVRQPISSVSASGSTGASGTGSPPAEMPYLSSPDISAQLQAVLDEMEVRTDKLQKIAELL